MRVFMQPALLATTFVHRSKPLTVTIWVLDDAHSSKLVIQLWSNLIDPRWASKDFKELRGDEASEVIGLGEEKMCRTFEVMVSTDDIGEGWYEFTARFKRECDEGWQWMGENQNSRVFVGNVTHNVKQKIETIDSIFCQKIDDGKRVDYVLQNNIDCWCVSSDTRFNDGQPTCVNFGRIRGVIQFLAIRRSSVWWTTPVTGAGKLDLQNMNAFYILIQQSTGHYVVLIPMVSGECTSSFQTDGDGNLQLITVNDGRSDGVAKFVIGCGEDPYAVSRACMEVIKISLGTRGKINEITNEQYYYDQLGYCTWNAFYKNVRDQYVMDTLQSLDKIGVHVGYVLLDDGWQQFNGRDQLESLEVDSRKFPKGLKGLINEAKKRFHYLKHFGVWHTLWGYWNGIDPFSKLSFSYKVEQVRKGDQLVYLIAPEDIQRFYQDLHGYLRDEGVSLVKVDSQGSFDLINSGETKHRQCLNIMQWMLSGPGMENSGNTGRPIFRDMFQSVHRFNEYHAAARAISGSPMYVTDSPYKHDVEVLNKCLVNTPTLAFPMSTRSTLTPSSFQKANLSTELPQKILRNESPALPSLSSLFQDSTKNDNLLKICNINKRIRVIGLWNCGKNTMIDQIFLQDIYGLEFFGLNVDDNTISHCAYAAYFFRNKKTLLIDPLNLDKRIPVMVQPEGFEILTVSPIDVSTGQNSRDDFIVMIACFGLVDKYNGSRAVHSAGFAIGKGGDEPTNAEDQGGRLYYSVELFGYGECGFLLDVKNGQISETRAYLRTKILNDEKVKYDWEKKLIVIRMDEEDMREDGFRSEGEKTNDDTLMVKLTLELVIR
ncbi:5775_t:CDS:2 [Acaulospora colombiana]|uniref:5775_t:CDS:1 n=1 Tax=Acaulospora colombiana TaxID=27376 RepID=A0ACA9LEF5_9GLOM|nr:5775_t:CDS:2 [Acaulospora colombiana]